MRAVTRRSRRRRAVHRRPTSPSTALWRSTSAPGGPGWTARSSTLTRKEFDLLALLATDPGALRTREEILEQVWDPHWYGPTKTLDVHMASLRTQARRPDHDRDRARGRVPPARRPLRRAGAPPPADLATWRSPWSCWWCSRCRWPCPTAPASANRSPPTLERDAYRDRQLLRGDARGRRPRRHPALRRADYADRTGGQAVVLDATAGWWPTPGPSADGVVDRATGPR